MEKQVYDCKEALIPEGIKDDLEVVFFKDSCRDMREVAETVTKTYGIKACVH